MEGKVPDAVPAPKKGDHISIDRFEVTHVFEEREEEEKVETAMALYEKAARARMPSIAPDSLDDSSEEEREARSQQLKLQQKCQDIAALMMVEELEDEEIE